jgi:outer membrane lipoprotein SlyB
MKKIFGLVMTFVLLAGAALPTAAQTTRRGAYSTRSERQRSYERQRAYEQRQREYYEDRYDDDRSVFEKHRDKITVAGGTAAGAAVGAATGGKKGAIIGALIGAGASALYTYKLRDKDDDWRR